MSCSPHSHTDWKPTYGKMPENCKCECEYCQERGFHMEDSCKNEH